jgi:hypothetical protein
MIVWWLDLLLPMQLVPINFKPLSSFRLIELIKRLSSSGSHVETYINIKTTPQKEHSCKLSFNISPVASDHNMLMYANEDVH